MLNELSVAVLHCIDSAAIYDSVENGTLSKDDEREDLIARITMRDEPISECVDLIFDTNDVIDDCCISEVVAIPVRPSLASVGACSACVPVRFRTQIWATS